MSRRPVIAPDEPGNTERGAGRDEPKPASGRSGAERRDTREASKRDTRDALIAAGLAEFAEHGLDVPSLDAICARAGFTRGAFYVHFRDRDDLLAAVVEQVLGSFVDAMIAPGDDPHDLSRTIARFGDAVAFTLASPSGDMPGLPLSTTVPFARVLDAIIRSAKLRERFTAILDGAIARLAHTTASGQEAGTVRPDVDPRQIAFLLAMVALGVMAAIDAKLPIDAPAASAAAAALLASPPAPAGEEGTPRRRKPRS